jgi:sugar phosphate isomerase/epimerase
VFHPGIPYRAAPKLQDSWLQNALDFWPDYIAQARQLDIIITIENIYESSPDIFCRLFAELGSEHFGHCFDIGHWNIFAEGTLEDWFTQLGGHIRHLHLHDNLGKSDQHLPLGRGQIDFSTLLKQKAKLPVAPTLTLEAHQLGDLEISLQAYQALLSA